MNKEQRIEQWRSMLIGRLIVERVTGLDNTELHRCLDETVAPRQCYKMARFLRRHKLLTMVDIREHAALLTRPLI